MATGFRSYVLALVVLAASTTVTPAGTQGAREDVALTSAAIDGAIKSGAAPADWRIVVRRLSLALAGTVPSLEEQRDLEALPESERIDHHLEALLASRRFADYWAERLARAFVGVDDGPFLAFRRRRFVYWLSDELAKGSRYDDIVQRMVAGVGLWTDQPGTNFITAHDRDPVRLTTRSARAFLGMRLDCAQCHDHPFAHWKQKDFDGLAAFYAGIGQNVTGIEDASAAENARVPFAPEALPAEGPARQRLAAWLTNPENPAFAKAIANRVWTLLVGKSLTDGGVDDIESKERVPGVLDLLAADFVEHGYDLRRLVRVVTRSHAFRAASSTESSGFGTFPMVALRAEQIAGALVQISSLHTVDADSHILWRLIRFGSTKSFVERYGDGGEHELAEARGTMMQRLVVMNGRVVRERVEANLLSAAGRIAALAPDDPSAITLAFRLCLTRDPTDAELAQLSLGRDRARGIEDLLWALVNTTEFSWSH